MVPLAVIIDTASSSGQLSEADLRAWAQSRTAFISSEMSQLGDERDAVAAALRERGLNVVMFEDLGGRDENAVRAYTEGVAQSDIYVGIVGDRYGRMQDSGRSATHDEYRLARARGKRISVWMAADNSNRQGDARDFVQEIETFHTTGRFSSTDDLAQRVVRRLAEIAADDLAPWVKVGEAVFRAERITERADGVEIAGQVRDREVLHYLTNLRPDEWNRSPEVSITSPDRTGIARITAVDTEARAQAGRDVRITAGVQWLDGTGGTPVGTSGFEAEELAEIGIRIGLLGEELPPGLQGLAYGAIVDTNDPLEGLGGVVIPEGAITPIARLLITEALVTAHRAGNIDELEVGPEHQGERHVRLIYTEPKRYSNATPARHEIEGTRAWE